MTYEEQLLTPEWQAKRHVIIERDWRMCQKCMSGQHLNVHHKYYIDDGRMAWEYPNSALITLCNTCHKLEHKTQVISGPLPIHRLEAALERLILVSSFPKNFGLNKKDENQF